MSNLVVMNSGKISFRQRCSGENDFIPSFIHLFTNQYQPVAGSVIGNFIEANFGGYAPGTLDNPATDPVVNGANAAVTYWDEQTWPCSGAPFNSIWGYWVIDDNGVLMWAELFDAAVPILAALAYIKITPKLTGKSEFGN